MSMNLAIIQGHLGGNIKIGVSKNGSSWCSFSLGVKEEKFTQWINVMCFGKNADIMKDAHKGDGYLVHGKLETSSYEDREGKKVYKTQIIASQILLAGFNAKPLEFAIEPKFDQEEEIPF